MVLLHAILDPKDEVIFPAPYWVSYPEMVKLAGGVPGGHHPRRRQLPSHRQEIADAVGSYTKAIIINSPNNPSGAMFSKDFIAEIVEFCEKKSLYLIMDDIYNRLVFDGKSAPVCYDYAEAPLEQSKLVVINGVSKMYAMTGFRIGWAIANKELVEAMATVQSQQTSGPSAPSQWAAVGALERRAVLRREPAHDAGKQPQRDGRAPARHRRRQSDQAGRHFLLLPRFQRLHEGFAEAGEFPPG